MHGRQSGRRVVDLSATINSVTTDRSARRALFAANIPLGASEDDVRSHFELHAGTVESLKIWKDHRGQQQLATVVFQFAADAKKALMQGAEFKGRRLMVAFAR
jgi:RNA recognition motif-containing protein